MSAPIVDPTFCELSFGFRPKRSAHQAVKQVRGYIEQGYRVAVDIDLSRFFDTVDYDILMARLSRFVKDISRAIIGPLFEFVGLVRRVLK